MPDNIKGPGGAPRRAKAKYQVFISSTLRDLHHERERVTWEILTARHIPAGMESFPGGDDRGWKIIQRTIDASDYYVLLVGGTYGTYDPEIGMSWTEREYHYAREKKIPVLAFIREDKHISKADSDSDPEQAERLRAFISSLEKAHHRKMWTTAEDLTTKVIQALRAQIDDDEESGSPRPGWYRGDQIPSAGALEEFARLSAENAELKARLATLEMETTDHLELVTPGEAAVSGEHTIRTKRINLTRNKDEDDLVDRYGALAYVGSEEYEAALEEYVRDLTFVQWIEFKVINRGKRPSKNVNVDFTVTGASAAIVGDLEKPSRTPVVDLAPEPGLRSDRHVYVDVIDEKPGLVFVRQRIKQINPGTSEALVRVGFRSTAPANADQFDFKVGYEITSESGFSTRGSFRLVANVVGSIHFSEEDLLRD